MTCGGNIVPIVPRLWERRGDVRWLRWLRRARRNGDGSSTSKPATLASGKTDQIFRPVLGRATGGSCRFAPPLPVHPSHLITKMSRSGVMVGRPCPRKNASGPASEPFFPRDLITCQGLLAPSPSPTLQTRTWLPSAAVGLTEARSNRQEAGRGPHLGVTCQSDSRGQHLDDCRKTPQHAPNPQTLQLSRASLSQGWSVLAPRSGGCQAGDGAENYLIRFLASE